jgi:hypothetical protein
VPSTPVTIEAEASGNVLAGGATAVACGSSSGGYRVGYIGGPGHVVVVASLTSSGVRTNRVTYESDTLRQLKVTANNADVDARWLTGTGWDVAYTSDFTTSLSAGVVQLMFYNDTTPAPDIDQVVIT